MPLFTLKLFECKQFEFSDVFLAAFANFKSFCITWIVLDTFSHFSFSSLKMCWKSLSFSLGISCSSPVYIASPFCLPIFDATCPFLQYTMLHHCIWRNSVLHCVLLSVATYSNRQIYSGLLVLGFFPMRSFKSITCSLSSFWDSFSSLASFSAYFSFEGWLPNKIIPYMKKWWFQFLPTTKIVQRFHCL